MNLTAIRFFLMVLKQRIVDRFTPSTGELIATLAKLETKIERSINKSYRRLASFKATRDRMDAAMVRENADVDAALKLLHKVADLSR